jgi:TolB-like protein
MVERTQKSVIIDLNQFKLHLHLKPDAEVTLHFDSPSRRFYLAVIGLVVHEMKKRGKISAIPLEHHLDVLVLLNQTVGGAAGSSQKGQLLHRIYRKWKDALPDLENAPLFKVVGRKKRYDESMQKVYGFGEGEKDHWANLFEYIGSHENLRLKFSVERLGANLKDVSIVYGNATELENENAWEEFIASLEAEHENNSKLGRVYHRPEGSRPVARRLLNWPRKTQSRWRLVVRLGLIGLIMAVAAVSIWKYKKPGLQVETDVVSDKPSIVVLPFVNMSGDPEQEYFSDGISEDLITDLSKIPDLLVISRNSAFTYKKKSLKTRQIARELGVRYVLEGSVRKADNRLRISAQLIDSTTGHHLWAERYDEIASSIFDIQDKITEQIVAALALKLTEDEHRLVVQKDTESLEAYNAFLKASNLTMRMDPDRYAEAVAWLEKAIELDLNYSRAYAALAEIYFYGTYMGFERILGISYRLARIRRVNYLRKAMLKPTSIAHRDSVFMYAFQRQFGKAFEHARRAFALDPNDAKTNQAMAFVLTYLGRYDEAIDFAKRSARVDPECYH